MKKAIIILAAIVGINSVSLAQKSTTGSGPKKMQNQNLTPEERANKCSERAAKKLGLDDQQKGNWQVAALKRIMVNQPLHEKLQGSTTPDERKQTHMQIRDNNQAFDSSVKEFLNDDQKAKYEAWKQEQKGKHKGKMKPGDEELDKTVDE